MTKSALLLIDIQNDYFPSFKGSKMPLPDMDQATANAARLLAAARDRGTPVIHVKHVMKSSAAPFFLPGTEGAKLHHDVTPLGTEVVVEKERPNSFIGTDLSGILQEMEIQMLTICGAMSQMCVDATVRAAVDLGFSVTVIHDACASSDIEHNGVHVAADKVHASIMAPLAASYATVQTTSEYLA